MALAEAMYLRGGGCCPCQVDQVRAAFRDPRTVVTGFRPLIAGVRGPGHITRDASTGCHRMGACTGRTRDKDAPGVGAHGIGMQVPTAVGPYFGRNWYTSASLRVSDRMRTTPYCYLQMTPGRCGSQPPTT